MLGGFTFNQFLVRDDESLLCHTGARKMFPLVREAVASLVPLARLRYISFSHIESDEYGGLNDLLVAAPHAVPLCGAMMASGSVNDMADRPARALAEGESLSLGKHTVRWFDTPHFPHNWEAGLLFEARTATLFCSDLFAQPGAEVPAITSSDILATSERFRSEGEFYSNPRAARPLLERLAAAAPRTLACMHGSAWTGDGGRLLLALADCLAASPGA
jgi:flavorubredoxin